MVIPSVFISVTSIVASCFAGQAGEDITKGEVVALHRAIRELKSLLARALDQRPGTAADAGWSGDVVPMV